MIRTQIQLTEQQAEALRKLAARQGRSLAELIRLSVESYLAHGGGDLRAVRVQRALRVVGRFSSGKPDVSAKHDRYLAEAYRG